MRPLAGRRILITRARSQAATLALALEEQGAEVLAIPAIEIAPPGSYADLDAALQRAASYQWLILTSVNGVEAMAARMRAVGALPSAFSHLRVAAIGPATARALERHGIRVDLVPQQYIAESIVEALRDTVSGARILLVRARVARDVIPVELRKLGAAVDVVEAYRTLIPESSCAELQRLFSHPDNLPHAITFTSSSTVSNFFALMQQAGFSSFPSTTLAAVSIGPVTSRTLRDHGIEPAAEALEFTIPGLVAALCAWSAQAKRAD